MAAKLNTIKFVKKAPFRKSCHIPYSAKFSRHKIFADLPQKLFRKINFADWHM